MAWGAGPDCAAGAAGAPDLRRVRGRSAASHQTGQRYPNINLESVLLALADDITFDGATGHVEHDSTNAPPRDRTLVLLCQTGNDAETALACGACRHDQSSEAQAPPCAG
ncbi:hypothetical protein [Streptomyces sp. S.PB5]|uniref:hypothetical protein n=1 Tax=Streptomyces sp. S.PB5 TaxID=3020844 RepID=UPI0025B164A0|nr:hypothetical protein [Streptomyces sp. S.PB5]MDN3028964.1 hypothetical protein [Streptomyces sp. S.PB5]